MILNRADNIMLGSQEVQKVCLGSQLIWERNKSFLFLDFIQTTNRQYFNTGYFPNENTKIECEVMLMDNYDGLGLSQALFGCSGFYAQYSTSGTHHTAFSFGGQDASSSKTLPYFQKIRLVLDSQALTWYDKNGTLIDSVSVRQGTFSTSGTPLWVGCRNNSGSVQNFGEFCLYSFKIYENNQPVMNFVPAKRVSDGVSGMLNTVTNTFCPDLNNNGFLSSVFEDNYAVVAYVNSDGNLYLNTGHTHTANTRFAIDFIPSLSGVSSFVQLWGAEANIGGRWTANDWWCYTENSALYVQRGRIESQQVSADLTQRMQITAEGLTAQFTFADETTQTIQISGASLLSGLLTMWLFKTHYDGNPQAGISQRFYSCQIYENNTLVRDFIPVKRLSDNALMLYDRVAEIEYRPIGGTFTEVS